MSRISIILFIVLAAVIAAKFLSDQREAQRVAADGGGIGNGNNPLTANWYVALFGNPPVKSVVQNETA